MPKMQNYTGDTPQYIAPFDVVLHNQVNDCWVSFLGKVYDITPLISEFGAEDCVKPLIAEAGKDISHWFDEHTGDIKHYVHPVTSVRVPYCPHGPIPHVRDCSHVPTAKWKPSYKSWWLDDDQYLVGYLTKKVRPLRIVNTFTAEQAVFNVCCEDTIRRITERYSIYNSDIFSYTWRYNGKNLCMKKTLEKNGIPDKSDKYTDLGLPASWCIPTIFIYYNDDLKWDDCENS